MISADHQKDDKDITIISVVIFLEVAVRRVRLTRAQQQAQTKERLLAAAKDVFSRLGYWGASLDAIAAEAGYSKGAIYSNFPNKETIILELLRLHMEREMGELEQVVQVGPDHILDTVRDWLYNMPPKVDLCMLVAELQLHASRASEFAKNFNELHDQKIDTIARILTTYFEAASAQMPMAPRDLAQVVEGLANALSLQNASRAAGPVNEAGRIINELLRALMGRNTATVDVVAGVEPVAPPATDEKPA